MPCWRALDAPDHQKVTEFRFEDLERHCPDVPTLGFVCNHNCRHLEHVEDEPMRRLRPGEPHIGGVSAQGAGWFSEQGLYPARVVQPDPLFAGLPDPFVVRESHYCEVKQLPSDFDLIATDENCRIQAMGHRGRLLYGTQFCPEAWQDEYPHGRLVLGNFYRLAGATGMVSSAPPCRQRHRQEQLREGAFSRDDGSTPPVAAATGSTAS